MGKRGRWATAAEATWKGWGRPPVLFPLSGSWGYRLGKPSFWSAQGSLNHRLTLLKSCKFYFTENCPTSFQLFADVPASSL